MPKYHYNSITGEGGICRAKHKCPICDEQHHFATKEELNQYEDGLNNPVSCYSDNFLMADDATTLGTVDYYINRVREMEEIIADREGFEKENSEMLKEYKDMMNTYYFGPNGTDKEYADKIDKLCEEADFNMDGIKVNAESINELPDPSKRISFVLDSLVDDKRLKGALARSLEERNYNGLRRTYVPTGEVKDEITEKDIAWIKDLPYDRKELVSVINSRLAIQKADVDTIREINRLIFERRESNKEFGEYINNPEPDLSDEALERVFKKDKESLTTEIAVKNTYKDFVDNLDKKYPKHNLRDYSDYIEVARENRDTAIAMNELKKRYHRNGLPKSLSSVQSIDSDTKVYSKMTCDDKGKINNAYLLRGDGSVSKIVALNDTEKGSDNIVLDNGESLTIKQNWYRDGSRGSELKIDTEAYRVAVGEPIGDNLYKGYNKIDVNIIDSTD